MTILLLVLTPDTKVLCIECLRYYVSEGIWSAEMNDIDMIGRYVDRRRDAIRSGF